MVEREKGEGEEKGKRKEKERIITNVLLVLIIFIVLLCGMAFKYEFPSVILGIPKETVNPPSESNPPEASTSEPTSEPSEPATPPFPVPIKIGDILTFGTSKTTGFQILEFNCLTNTPLRQGVFPASEKCINGEKL